MVSGKKKPTKIQQTKLEKLTSHLTAKQKLFCEVYITQEEFFCNGLKSYMKAYGLKYNKQNINTAKSNAYKLLTNTYILTYINELMDLNGFNNAFADKQLKKVMMQDVDLSAKMAGVREFNKLKSRITENISATITEKVELGEEERKTLKGIGKAISKIAAGVK